MSRLLKIHRKPRCFYCQHTLDNVPDPNNFECPSCSSMNHYDPASGEILSSAEPAMYDARLNMASFSRRATPSKTEIPTKVEQSVFCRECTVNQTLVTNMLANYLPTPSDPSYQALVETLPEYKRSLETRYPLVCERCLPLVEEKLLNKEHMARSKALGGWLNATPHQVIPRRPGTGTYKSSIMRRQKERPWKVRVWILQGTLYVITTMWVVVSYLYGISRRHPPPIRPPSPFISITSLIWNFWDRTWLQVHRAHSRGLSMRTTGRKDSIRIQFVLWASRLCMSILASMWGGKVTEGTYGAFMAVEIVLGGLAITSVKAVEPPPIMLSRHSSMIEKKPLVKRRSSFKPTESFSAPVKQTSNQPRQSVPMFGAPSLATPFSSAEKMLEEMDWTPQANLSLFEDEAFALKPGRLSANPTGLEGLLAGTSLAADSPMADAHPNSQESSDLFAWIQQQDLLVMGGVIITIAMLLIGAVLPAWQRQKGALWDPSWEWSHFESRSPQATVASPAGQGTETQDL